MPTSSARSPAKIGTRTVTRRRRAELKEYLATLDDAAFGAASDVTKPPRRGERASTTRWHRLRGCSNRHSRPTFTTKTAHFFLRLTIPAVRFSKELLPCRWGDRDAS